MTHSKLSDAPDHKDGDIEDLKAILTYVIQTMSDETLKKFLVHFFESNVDFFFAPGARSDVRGHHSFKGGLAYHTLHAARLAGKISGHYSAIGIKNDRNLVVAGVLLHDVGKIDSYEWAPDFDVDGEYSHTKLGKLHHHIPIGFHKVLQGIKDFNLWQEALDEPQLSDDVANQLGHIILAHHGRKSWSSPVTPQNIEAYIVHSVEMMDSYVYKFNRGDDVRSIYDN